MFDAHDYGTPVFLVGDIPVVMQINIKKSLAYASDFLIFSYKFTNYFN